jgi:UDP-glucose 4-epimerase
MPISGYGLSKIISEKYIEFFSVNSEIQYYILRPSNVYGLYQNFSKPQGIIGFAFKSIINNTSLNIYDEGKVTRDFIYVSDLAEAINCCIDSEFKNSISTIYNVGSQKGYSIIEILNKIKKITQKELLIIAKPSRSFDCNYNVLNIEKIKAELNWQPKIELDEGLKYIWNWIKNEK